MHICYILWKFRSPKNFQQMGGAENQLLKIIKRLQRRKDIKITIISRKLPDDPIKEIVSSNIKIQRINSSNIPVISLVMFSIVLFFKLIKINSKERINIIHLPLPDLYLSTLYLLRRILKIPVITRIAADELSPYSSHGLWLVERLFVRKLILQSDGLQTLNNQAYDFAKSAGFDIRKLFLIPNGIEKSKFFKKYEKLTHKIVYIGAMRHNPKKHKIEQKNLEFLILAFNDLLKYKSDLELIMVGDGNYRNTLERLVKMLDLNNNVVFYQYEAEYNQLGCFYTSRDVLFRQWQLHFTMS